MPTLAWHGVAWLPVHDQRPETCFGLHTIHLQTAEGREATGNTSCNKATIGDTDSRANLAPKP
ncbi:hypothetical protein EYF80_002375 [Liparis tanakae]|uniref:Uncharacterized protein n=1 Tax=Liparis tanakae TaxID=230148 RepID=A0A4Z2JBP0_9TELE|nr:hypothetical protein EYF80_002375 [Liparis tanakae]